jgi:diaminopimelate decarboxylase
LRAAGERVETLDCGGGLGIGYRNQIVPGPDDLAAAIRGAFHNLDVRLHLEPGRWLVGPPGLLLASVVLTKVVSAKAVPAKAVPGGQSPGARFVVLDAGMNDLLRPAMYDAWHGIVPIGAAELGAPGEPADVVGPVCESSDIFARGRLLPPLAPGARVAILDAGAYGAVMSSAYNARPRAAEVMVDGARWSLIRARQPLAAMWADERLADPPA